MISALKGRRGTMAAWVLVGLATGSQVASERERFCVNRWRPGERSAMVSLHDRAGPRGLAAATVTHAPEGCVGRVLLRFPVDSVRSGSRLLVVGKSRPRGILSVSHFRVLQGRRNLRYRMRESLQLRIRKLYGDRAAVVEALVLGRRLDLDPGLRRVMTRAGLAHLMAISGLHVGLIAGWIVMVARLTPWGRNAWLVAALSALGYVALLGFPAPGTRAAAFIGLRALAGHLERHLSGTTVLFGGVLVLLLFKPGTVLEVGSWLSVAAVAGVMWAGRRIPRRFEGSAWARLGAASVGATLFTAPITAWQFGSVAPVGVIANLWAVPLAGVVLPAMFLSLVLEWLAPGAGLGLALLEQGARWFSHLPGGALEGNPGLRFAVPWILALLLAGRAKTLFESTAGHRPLAVTTVVFALLAVRVLSASTSRLDPGLNLFFLDVGQGDAMVFRTPGGSWGLVDAGPRFRGFDAGRAVVVPFLRRMGVKRLALALVSHGDADHLGGVPSVLERIETDLVLDPGQPLGSRLYLEHLGTVESQGVRWQAARTGDRVQLDSVRLEILHPTQRWVERHLEPNENSLVVRLVYRELEVLLTGDIGWPAESALVEVVGSADLLKVAHHGSLTSSSPVWLDSVRPRAAVLSVGRNRYGHPARKVLDRLERRGIVIYRTDSGGTVTINSDGSYFRIRQDAGVSRLRRVKCLLRTILRSSSSSSTKRGCTRKRPVTSRTFSTT